MLDLNNRNWASFKISDLFQPARGTEKNMTSLQVGDVPLISARNCDNGVKAFVSIPSERLHHGHAITLNNDGDGGAGLAFMLPSANSGEPDFTFMEMFGMSITLQLLLKQLAYLKKMPA